MGTASMTPKHHADADEKPDLLKLWMGSGQEEAAPEHSGLVRRFLTVVLALCGLIGLILMAKYAIDVLAIVLGISIAGVLLHAVATRVAGSYLLSPGGLAMVVFGVLLMGYAVLGSGRSFEIIAKYVPAPVHRFFDWSEEHGWARHALSPADVPSSGASSPAVDSQPSRPASDTPAGAGGTGLALAASSGSSAVGQPIALSVRLAPGLVAPGSRATVRFYDGSTVIAETEVRSDGQSQIAVATVGSLSEGRHQITAELVGASSAVSQPVIHVVGPRQ